jgi:hypothetical protein
MNHRDSSVPASEAAVEQEIQAKGLTAPRVTPEHIDAQIVRVDYLIPGEHIHLLAQANGISGAQVPLSLMLLTICVLTLANGFTVTGESACASPENFDAELGRKIAFRNARDKIWALEGYQLRSWLQAQKALASASPEVQAAAGVVSAGFDANGSPVGGDAQFGQREG